MELKPEVLIVGAGVAGVALAVSLKRRGANVLLVERDPEVKPRFKGEFLQPAAVERMEKLGLGEVLSEAMKAGEANAIRELRFRDLLGSTSADPVTDLLVRYPGNSFGVSLSQEALVGRLRELARRELGENFLEGVTLQIRALRLERPRFWFSQNGSRRVIAPRLVVGADGRHSTVRSWMGGPKARTRLAPVPGAREELIVGANFEADSALPHRYEVIRSGRKGTFSFFQLSPGRQRLYWNTPNDSKREAAGKSEWKAFLETELTQTLSRVLRQDAPLSGLAGAPADTQWMGPARRGKFLLVGDALAVGTPLGGQGMSSALEQVERLVEGVPVLLRRGGLKRLAEFGREHHRQSREHFEHVRLMNFFLYHLCFSRSPVAQFLGRRVFRRWNEEPALRSLVAEYFSGLKVEGLGVARVLELLGVSPARWRFFFPGLRASILS